MMFFFFKVEGDFTDDEIFLNDPQFTLDIPSQNSNKKISMIISLMQTEQIRKRLDNKGIFESSNEAIAFSIHRPKKRKNDKKYSFNEMEEIQSTGVYLAQREVTKRIDLLAGSYIVRPSIFDPKSGLKFFLRVLIESGSSLGSDNIQVNFLKTEKVSNNSNDENCEEIIENNSEIIENNEEIIENNEEDALNTEEQDLEQELEGIFSLYGKHLDKIVQERSRKITNSKACLIM